jgi:hypothetical protein
LRFARWIVAVPLGLLAGWLVLTLTGITLDAFGVQPPGWLFYVVMAYAWLAAGFLFAGIATKLVPRRRLFVSVALVGVALGAAVLLAVRDLYGVPASILFGASLLAGAVGYSLRLRGFTEPLED